jgi:hypothetical protein
MVAGARPFWVFTVAGLTPMISAPSAWAISCSRQRVGLGNLAYPRAAGVEW